MTLRGTCEPGTGEAGAARPHLLASRPQFLGPSQPHEPELSAASSGIHAPRWTLGALAPALALLNPVCGEGLLLRTSGNVSVTRLIT